MNLLHKLLPDSTNTICCSIQFAHSEAPIGYFLLISFFSQIIEILILDRSTLFYASYGHGAIKVYDYTNGKILGQMPLVKQSKATNLNDPRCKTYYPLAWIDANTLLTGNLE